VDGDTLDVRLTSGRRDRIRVLGIDTPERGACYAAEATARTRALAGGRRVRLIGDARQATRDRFGRRLAYITLPTGSDLGRQLLAGGFAKVLVVGRPFTRHASYVATENAAKNAGAGMWTTCAAPADLAITTADAPDPVTVGAQLTYTVTVANAGPGRAQNVTITDNLPAGVSLVPTSSSLTFSGTSRGSCTGAPTVTCAVDALDAGATATLTLVVTVGVAGTLTNTATVTAATADPNASNNSAGTTTGAGSAPPPPPPPQPPPCSPSYPTVCIPPPPPDLDCSQIPYRNFQVIYTVPSPDPHNFDGDRDGVGCES
jgi:uncharacterized repeat protein (TIGR01451 family)